MPIIDHIEHGTYNEKFDSYLAKHDYHEEPNNAIKKFLKELQSGDINDESIKSITGLDEESFQLNGGSPLNQLSINLQNDINDFLEEIDNKPSEAFLKEVRNHREEEANKSLEKEKDWFIKTYFDPLVDAVEKYNNNSERKFKKYEDGEDTGEYGEYSPATIVKSGPNNLNLSVSYIGGTRDPRKDITGNRLIAEIEDIVPKAREDYYLYVKPVEDLCKKYPFSKETIKSPSILKSIKEDLWNNANSKKTSTSTDKNNGNEVAGYIKDTPVYIKDGNCYTKDKDGNLQQVYYFQNDKKIPVTEDMLKDPKTIPANVYYQNNNGTVKINQKLSNIKQVDEEIDGSEFIPTYKAKNLITGDKQTIYKYNNDYYYEKDGEMVKQNRFAADNTGYNKNLREDSAQAADPVMNQAKIQLKNGDWTFNDTYIITEEINATENDNKNNTYLKTSDGKIYQNPDNEN